MSKMHYVLLAVVAVLVVQPIAADTLTVRPDGQGSWAEWSNKNCPAGNGEWQCVDEVSPAAFDRLLASGQERETFTFGDTGLTAETINSVTLYYYMRNHNNNGNSCISPMVRSNGTDYVEATQLCQPSSSWTYKSFSYTSNPATGSAWTVSAIDALEAGMKGTSPDDGGRVAQVYAVVDYASQFCGNDVIEGNETCDGTDLGNTTCQSLGFDGGSLGCQAGCAAYDTSGCFTDSCTDTDGSLFAVFTPGNVTGENSGTPFGFADFCAGNETLIEFGCSGSLWTSINFSCALNGTFCSAGACV